MDVSAMVKNWMMVVRTVVASLRANADVVGAAVERELFPGDPADRARTLILARADALERKLAILEARDRAVAHERGDDAAVAEEQGAALAALRQIVIRIKARMTGLFDAPVLAGLSLTGETPSDADALRQYAATARDALRTATLPSTAEEGATIDPVRQAELLEAGIARLAASSNATAVDAREEQTAVNARNEAEADLRRTYIAAADGFAADAVLAGRPDIAARIRPTSRRRSGLPEPVDLDPEGGGAEEREREFVTGSDDAG